MIRVRTVALLGLLAVTPAAELSPNFGDGLMVQAAAVWA